MKNKIFKLVVALLLAVLTLGSVACDNTETVDVQPTIERVTYQGTHDINVTETNEFLVKDGRTDYTVIIPANCNKMITQIKTDFIILFKKATGINLAFRFDDTVNDFKTTDKYISIGETTLVEKAGIAKSEYSAENIKKEGVRLITKDNAIFILGGSDTGVCNAVYSFLEIYFNYDFYYRNCIEIDTNVINCNFKKLDVTDVPDVNSYYGCQQVYEYDRSIHPLDAEGLGADTVADEIAVKNLRAGQFIHPGFLFLPVHKELTLSSPSGAFHNVMYYITNNEENRNMFSPGGSQLCYTAHGDPEDLERMLDLCAEKIIFSLKNYTPKDYPYRNYISITMTDNSDICNCPACKADYAEVGYAGNLIKFVNKLGERVQAWLDEQKDENAEFHYAYRENFKIITYGYNIYTDPPVKEDGTPISEDVVCNENVGIWHVSSRGVSAHADIYDEKWPTAIKQIKGWKTITQKSKCLWFWHNSGNVVNNIYFADGFTTYNNNFFEAMAYGGYENVYAAHFLQGGGEMTAWQNCLSYVSEKIRWDCHADMDYYIRKYMNAMYLDAGDIMYNLLQSERVHYASLVVDAKENNNWGREMNKPENYSYLLLKSWVDMCDAALDKIAYIEVENADLYKVVHQRIELETIAHLYKIVDLYGGATMKPFTEETLAGYKQRIRNIGLLAPDLMYAGKPLYEVG